MADALVKPGEQTAEFVVPQGCILCGGQISFKVTPKGAVSCCIHCRWISEPQIAVGKRGLQVEYRASARA
jgi:hypothetical protein